MVVDSISDFFVSNIYAKKFLGIDYGLKHIGVAVSDSSNIISVPYSTFTEEEILTKICQIIKDENIFGIIIGKPYHLDGSASEMIQNVEKFSKKLLD